MIPSDLAARLRMLTEASFFSNEPQVPGLARAREIQGQLPELLPGQRFTAVVQRALPDGTFQAVVAGRVYTLALNHAASPGDSLELVVTQTTPRAVYAQHASPEAAAAQQSAQAGSQATLSATGRLIGFLLTGQPAPQPTPLAGGQPLLPAPPANGAPLVPLLRQALGQSGLFYESHQAQWVTGKLDLAALTAEPQGQHPAAARAPVQPGPPASPPAAAQGMAAAQPQGDAAKLAAGPTETSRPDAGQATSRTGAGPGSTQASLDRVASPNTSPATPAGNAPIPERLLPIVHQQLDVLATHHLVVQTQAWPGQMVEWEIEDSADDGNAEGEDAASTWNTTLRLTLPRLGGVEARLHLTPAGVAVRLLAGDAGTQAALGAGHETLESALAAAGVPLTGFVVEAPHEQR